MVIDGGSSTCHRAGWRGWPPPHPPPSLSDLATLFSTRITSAAACTKLTGSLAGLASAGMQEGAAWRRTAVSIEGRPAREVSCEGGGGGGAVKRPRGRPSLFSPPW